MLAQGDRRDAPIGRLSAPGAPLMSTTGPTLSRLSSHSLLDPSARPPPRRARESSTQLATIREVLACIDGSEFGRGMVPHARLVSSALGARLTLLHVLESDAAAPAGPIPADPLDWGLRQREARAQLDRMVAGLGDQEAPPVRSALIQGRAAEQICGWAERHAVDLTVFCSHGSSGLTDWELASTARKLIDRVPGSLMLVPGAVAARSTRALRYRKLLVPLDGSARAESVIPVAMRIAADQGAEVVFAHVVTSPEVFRVGPMDAEASELEKRVTRHNRRAATAYLERIKARSAVPACRIHLHTSGDGNARAQLDELIREEEPDLVVMSAHGATGHLGATCGCVAEYALVHTTVPILVLRARGAHHPAERVQPTAVRRVAEGSAGTSDAS
jgi:nucleotide-binding universal stress UspA family protein